MSTGRFKASMAAAALAATVGVIPLTAATATPAFAEACKPKMTHDAWATPDGAYDIVTANPCAARKISDTYGTSSGVTGIVSFVAGWVPAWPAKAISGYFGIRSIADFFVGSQLSKCSKNFTKSIRLTNINGYFQGCKTI